MKLSAYIKTNGMTQEQFAATIPCRPEYLSGILNGKRKPSDILIKAIFGMTDGDVDGIGDIVNDAR